MAARSNTTDPPLPPASTIEYASIQDRVRFRIFTVIIILFGKLWDCSLIFENRWNVLDE